MPDEVRDDNPKGEEGSQGPPTPDVSAGSTDAGSAQPGFDAAAFETKILDSFDALRESIPDLVDAGIKSTKDKRFNKLTQAEEILAAVELAGGDLEKIRGKLESDALLHRLDAIEEKLGSGGVDGTTPTEDAQTKKLNDDTAELLKNARAEHGVEITDEELTELMRKQPRWTAPEWLSAVAGSVIKKAKQGNIGAGASAGASGAAVTPTDDNELLEDMEKLMKHPVANVVKIRELKTEAVRRGLLQ